ncbi:phage portal protein [Peptoniphilus sp. SGI.035]|uniref:phage portal protein n=1 Tax=Peptoniphilus sp. SGI.035 TaxID=3420564 RepID=UPI003D044A53
MDNLSPKILIKILNDYRNSQDYKEIVTSYEYYNNKQEVLDKKRLGIGEVKGTREVIENLPNNKIMRNQYAVLVDQKKNYLLTRPIGVSSENKSYQEKLQEELFDFKFHKLIKSVGRDSILANMGYIYPYIDVEGEFKLMKFDPLEIIPIWEDKLHTWLQGFIRFYKTVDYEDNETQIVEYYHMWGIDRYEEIDGELFLREQEPYFMVGDEIGNWGRIPLVYFRMDEQEQPLLNRVKTLQDAINSILSKFMDSMDEDSRNTILVLKNIGGHNEQDLKRIRREINRSGIIAFSSNPQTGNADVETLKVDIDITNYKIVLDILIRSLIEVGRGVDTNSELFQKAVNQMTIQSLYTNIDLDANEMETEYKVSLDILLYFYNFYKGYDHQSVKFTFDRNVLINESATIENAQRSIGVISNRTIMRNHPWVEDIAEEEKQVAKEMKEESDYDGVLEE